VTSALSWPKSWYVLEPSKSTASADAFTGLAPGDILLSCPSEPTAVQHAVQKLQARWYANQHAAFTHVGVYVGEDWVVDAVPQFGVSRRSLGSFGIACSIRARRSRGISADQQQAIVDLATRWAALGNRIPSCGCLLPHWPKKPDHRRSLGGRRRSRKSPNLSPTRPARAVA
jgi:hypothetical protein